MKQVVVVDEPRINLMGLIVRSVFSDELAGGNDNQRRRIERLRGTLHLYADRMAVRVTFGDTIAISPPVSVSVPATHGAPRATVRGDLSSLVGLIARKKFLWAVLTRKIRVSGNLLLLLKVFFVFLAIKREVASAR